MTYGELQSELRRLRSAGRILLIGRLNHQTKEILQAEYNRLMAIEEPVTLSPIELAVDRFLQEFVKDHPTATPCCNLDDCETYMYVRYGEFDS